MTDEAPWIKWAWRYMVLEMNTYASLDEAIEAAACASDNGEEALHAIEGPDGVVDHGVVERRMDEIYERQYAEHKARREASPRPFAIKLRGPDNGRRSKGDFAWFGTYPTAAERDESAERLRVRFGDRVKVGKNPWP